jgi:hypothetical protein
MQMPFFKWDGKIVINCEYEGTESSLLSLISKLSRNFVGYAKENYKNSHGVN